MLTMNVYLGSERAHVGRLISYVVYNQNIDHMTILDRKNFYADFNPETEVLSLNGVLSHGIFDEAHGVLIMPDSTAVEASPRYSYDIYM